MQSVCEILWMLRPEVLLSPHLSSKKSRKILIRRSLTRQCIQNHTPNYFGSWMVDTWLPGQPLIPSQPRGIYSYTFVNQNQNLIIKYVSENSNASSDLTDEGKKLETSGSDFLVSKQLLGDLDFEDDLGSEDIYDSYYQPVEEPWLVESSELFKSIRKTDPSNLLNNINLNQNSSEREYPVEEPWLSIEVSNNNEDPEITEVTEITEVPSLDKPSLNELEEIPKNLFHDNESRVGVGMQEVDTVILINSSLCTMQRVAVMEDEKLVEILLEPIKNNVHCDSVYIGVVSKLVPHMGGAFVNIGHARASLVEIKHHLEPFIFPPFSHYKDHRSEDGSLLVELLEHPTQVNEKKHKSEHVEVVDNINDDEFGEHDIDDEFDVSEDFEGNGDGLYINGKRNIFQPISPTLTNKTAEDKENGSDESTWAQVQRGTKIIVQVVKEGLGTKGPTLTAYPKLRSRFWVCSILKPVWLVFMGCGLDQTQP